MNTQETALLTEQLARHEGYREKPYRCTAGKLTIGYGHNLEDRGINERVARLLLHVDIDEHTAELIQAFPEIEELNPPRQAVLINMGFNLGIPKLMHFKRALQAIRDRDFTLAAKEMLDSKWARQVGRRAVELAEQMKSGRWPQ